MKIVSTGSTISSSEFHKKRLKARRNKLILLSALLVVLLISAVLILRIEKLRINTIAVSGAVVTGSDSVTKVIEETISGYYLWLLPRESAALYPKNKIISELKENFPRLSSVEISLVGAQELHVVVAEREPEALYCAGDLCYFLDASGFIFDTAPVFSEGVYFVYQKEVPIEKPRGGELLSQIEFEQLSRFIEAISKLGTEPEKLDIKNDQYELMLSNGALVIWPEDSDYGLLYSNLETFLSTESVEDVKEFWSKISELDLRTPNKVFYRYREQ